MRSGAKHPTVRINNPGFSAETPGGKSGQNRGDQARLRRKAGRSPTFGQLESARKTVIKSVVKQSSRRKVAAMGERTAVILDCQPLWRDAIEDLLRHLGIRVIGKTGSGAVMVELVHAATPDILVLGLDEADDGLACLRRAKDSLPSLRALVVSAREDAASIEAAFAAGATVYCLKTTEPDDFASAVRQAFAPSIFFATAPAGAGSDESVTRLIPTLTKRELEILRLVAEGHSNAQLAQMLWVTEQTVKFHLSNIYRKLKVSNRTEASSWAHRHGLLASSESAVVPDSSIARRA
jgi:DNA-binding NarL/FixJ family response regulator